MQLVLILIALLYLSVAAKSWPTLELVELSDRGATTDTLAGNQPAWGDAVIR